MSKVLVVEDNQVNRMLVEDLLEAHGYEVISVENGEEGIKKAKEIKPSIILMDIQMPGMDGTEAANIIKNDTQTSDIKIVAITSYAMKGDREKYISLGFDDYMAKPIDTRGLARLVKELV